MRIVPKRPAGGKTLADAILGFGNAFAGFCEWLEDVEQGAEPMRAAKKAYKKVRRRGTAMKRVTSPKPPSPEPEPSRPRVVREAEGVVIDVTPEVERRRRESSR